MSDGVARHRRLPSLGVRYIGDYDGEPFPDRAEVALDGGIERRGVQHHEARCRIGLQPVAAEHAHDETRRTRHQQCHSGLPRKPDQRGKFISSSSSERVPTAKSSSDMVSSGLWLPLSLRTKIMALGMPTFVNTAAS